jgi:hypothetical protein
MEQQKKRLAILNLTGEFIPELTDYFASRGVLVVDPLVSSREEDWTHIITKDVHDFDLINETNKLIANNRHIISLTKINDLQNFTVNNGNLILDDSWFKGPMGSFIMDKYFHGYGGITLGDNYPAFKEQGAFNIANPFNTGEYLDRMVNKAFEGGVEALTLKTYFDHLLMYLAGLKKKGKAGYPFEVTYGAFEDIFAIQIHFFCHNLSIMDVSTSLSSKLSKKAEEYFLNVAVQSADFFDFSYMPEVKKVVVTGLWTKDERIQFENRGLMFTSLEGGMPLAQYQGDVTAAVVEDLPFTDFTDKISLPDRLPPEVSTTVLASSEEDGNTSSVVSGTEDEAQSSTIVSGSDEDLAESTLVSGILDEDLTITQIAGIDETDDEALLIKGEKELDELVQHVRGNFEEEDKSVMRISGNKLDIDEVAFRIASSVDKSTKENNLQVRTLGDKLPDKIKTGLFDFAKNLDKDVEDLDDSDLDRFQIQKMPAIIQRSLASQVIEESVKNSKDLNRNKALENSLKNANAENEKLKIQVKAMTSEVRILKESRKKLAEIQLKATQASHEVISKQIAEDDEVLRKQFQQKIHEQKVLNEHDLKKLAAFLERESKLIADVKQEELKFKRLQLESIKKESFFTQELEKSERTNKAKDLILIKTKETFTKLMDRKSEELSALQAKTDQLSKALTNGPAAAQTQLIKDLEKNNQTLNKQLEVYKIKISSLTTNMQASKPDENLAAESRKLQMLNQQMKNQLDLAKKEADKLHVKLNAETSQITLLRQDKAKLESILKKATIDAKEVANTPAPMQINVNDQEMRRLQAQNQILESHVKDSMLKVSQLEAKLAEVSKAHKAPIAGEDSSKVKQGQLENSVKKLTQDLVESRNQMAEMKKETNKLRQDKTALQNQVDKMKKEADKAKPAMPKKPGGKAA